MTQSQLPDFGQTHPVDLIQFARNLAQSVESAAQRTAGDRAYYAAFLASREFFAAKGYLTATGSARDHQLVALELRARGGNRLGNRLEQLRRARNKVTYELTSLYSLGALGDRHVRPLSSMITIAEEVMEGVTRIP